MAFAKERFILRNTLKDILMKILRPARLAVGRFGITPDILERLNDMQLRTTILYKAARLIAAEKIHGDYLEFGVYSGGNFSLAYAIIQTAFQHATSRNEWNTEKDINERQQIWDHMRFFAFDSFQGLPSLGTLDAVSQDFVEGKYACSESRFLQNISVRGGVPLEKVISIPGWFDQSLTSDVIQNHRLKTATIVYIDCDLYESTIPVLEFITPLLVDGSLLIFDDWYNYKGNLALGEQRACREWLQSHPELELIEYQKEGPWKNSFIVHLLDGG